MSSSVQDSRVSRPRTAAAQEEDSLLERVAQGDQAAFSRLYDLMIARVLWQVQRSLIDQAQTEEVAQEVFLEVWQNASRFDAARGRAAGWIMTMAHRRAVDRVRAAHASRARDLAVGIRDWERDVDVTWDRVEIDIEFERVQHALARMSAVQRETIVLTYQHGRTNREISEILGLPIGTVKTRLRDGLIRLRQELGAVAA